MTPAVSIIIPVKEINDYVREAIPHHLNLGYANFEVLVLPDYHHEEYFGSRVKIIPTHPLTGPADKRDLGAKKATGEILAFIDDDAYPHRDWLKRAVEYFNDAAVAAVCGPGVTPPSNSTLQKAAGWVQASRLGGGNYTYRFIPEKRREVDDYASMNLIVRKADFDAVGGFDSQYWPGEDTKLCLDLTHKRGKKIIYDPDVLVYHHRRPLFRPYLKQVGGYGLHRGHFARVLPKTSRRLSYFVPSIFLVYIFSLLALPLFSSLYTRRVSESNNVLGIDTSANALFNRLPLVALTPLVIYAFLLLLTALWVYRREKGSRVALLTIPGIFLSHLYYGLRFIQGFFARKLER